MEMSNEEMRVETSEVEVQAAKRESDRCERGATLVEYGLLIGLITVLCIAAITLIGTRISTRFSSAAAQL